MPPAPRISEAEWEVMEVVWQSHPITALAVVRELAPRRDWKDQTIRTMLGRLVRKRALAYVAEGKTYLYRPLVNREDCLGEESESFLKRVLQGAAQPFLVRLVEETPLTPAQIAELKRILKRKEQHDR